ncbi:MAG: hypothetical protein GY754_43395 [bacterium]|nr:hypothetical protein [bacterium]
MPRKSRIFKIFLAVVILISLSAAVSAKERYKTIHVFVALCDNKNQGIVPVPPRIGNGEDARNNLYWGAAAGVKTYFRRSKNWRLIRTIKNPSPAILERVVFKHKRKKVILAADAYRGIKIKKTIIDFLNASAGSNIQKIRIGKQSLSIGGGANLLAYIGHDGLMDFSLDSYPERQNRKKREVIILACVSKTYFRNAVQKAGAVPVLWTTGLMCPEAYTLKSAIDGWIKKESNRKIRLRAAKAYHKYQKCGLRAAKRLLVTGW